MQCASGLELSQKPATLSWGQKLYICKMMFGSRCQYTCSSIGKLVCGSGYGYYIRGLLINKCRTFFLTIVVAVPNCGNYDKLLNIYKACDAIEVTGVNVLPLVVLMGNWYRLNIRRVRPVSSSYNMHSMCMHALYWTKLMWG